MSVTVAGLEEALEAWQDFILDVTQRPVDNAGSIQEPPRSQFWLIEAYREKKCGIDVGLTVRAGDGEPKHVIAVAVGAGVEAKGFNISPPSGTLGSNNGDEQFSMLVAIVEPREDGKLVVRWSLSFVWLYLIKDLPNFLRYTWPDVGETVGALAAPRWAPAGGEARLPGGTATCRYDELPGEVVKRYAKVVNGISDDETQSVWHGRHMIKPDDVFRSLLIVLSDNGISVRRLDSSGFDIKIMQVGFCPLDLGQNA